MLVASGIRLIRNKQFPGTGDTTSALKNSSEKEKSSRVADREGEQKVRACEKLNEILERGRASQVHSKSTIRQEEREQRSLDKYWFM